MEHFKGKLIYSLTKTFLLIYLRFIDNIFFMWTGSKTDLENLLNKVNAKHPSIKFKCEILKERNSFLDTKKYIKSNKLNTQIFRNKTNTQGFLGVSKIV